MISFVFDKHCHVYFVDIFYSQNKFESLFSLKCLLRNACCMLHFANDFCEGIKCEFYMVSPYLTRNLKYKKGDSNMLADTKSAHTLHFITIELLIKY